MDLSNPLSAASLLLAVVAVLFGAWSGDVSSALALKLPKEPANRGGQQQDMRDALIYRSTPLVVGGWLTAAVFAQRAFVYVAGAIGCLWAPSCRYDDVQAAFVLSELFVIVIAVWSTIQLARLVRKLIGSYS